MNKPICSTTEKSQGTCLTLGNFDGVHRGHRALIDSMAEFKSQHPSLSKIKTTVLTFEPHPVEVLRPGTTVSRLSTQSEKVALLQGLGVDEVIVLPFDENFAKTKARDFFEQVLIERLNIVFLTIGQNFFFGHEREGTPEKLMSWCREKAIPAKLSEPVKSDGEIISSSLIRKLLESGNVGRAAHMLGRHYSLNGQVLHGAKRGRQLGFPTANVLPQNQGIGRRCFPAKGVYATTAWVKGRSFDSVTNVGTKPTVTNAGELSIESHLFDFHEELYGQDLTLEFKDRIRDERKFSGLEELKTQIQQDCLSARLLLNPGRK